MKAKSKTVANVHKVKEILGQPEYLDRYRERKIYRLKYRFANLEEAAAAAKLLEGKDFIQKVQKPIVSPWGRVYMAINVPFSEEV